MKRHTTRARTTWAGWAVATTTLALACADMDAEPPPAPMCREIVVDACSDGAGDTYRFVVSSIDVPAVAMDETQLGLDVDCRTSDRRDAETCGVADRTSPSGEEGIDNALGFLIGTLDDAGSNIDIRGASEAGFAAGTFVLPIVLTHVQDLSDDACMAVTVAGTTAEVAVLEGGELRASFDALPISLPTTANPLAATLEHVTLRARVTAAGIEDGILAGELSVDAATDAAVAVAPDDMLIDYVRPLVEAVADLAPDAAGDCQRVSIGIAFAAVPVMP